MAPYEVKNEEKKKKIPKILQRYSVLGHISKQACSTCSPQARTQPANF